jgi:DNA-binding NarL/FixJ family response regulator
VRVLIVDDHPTVRSGLAHMVDSVADSAHIDESDSADGALGQLQSYEYDLVLLDLMLPGAGEDMLDRITEAAGSARILVISMIEDSSYVRRALDSGASGYLPKTASPAVTRDAVRLVLDGGTYIPEQALREGSVGDGASPHPMRGLDPAAAARAGLTRMQHRVLLEMARGASNKQIAEALGLSISTVKAHVGAVIRKLGARNRTHAVLTAQREGVV